MDFGRVKPEQLAEIDFKLPSEPIFNAGALKGHPVAQPKIWIGASNWGSKEWVGPVYPRGTKEADYMEQFTKQFGCFELNATHYKIYDHATIRKWAARAAGTSFQFCPKLPQTISHFSQLRQTRDLTNAFIDSIAAFEEHLGPVFMQLSERFSPGRMDELLQYLENFPKIVPFYLELRHPGWFEQLQTWEQLISELKKMEVGLVITDTAGRRDCAHMHLTTPRTFVRFVGNNGHPTDYERTEDWTNRIRYWISKGLESVHLFMHMHDNQQIPQIARHIGMALERQCGIPVIKPTIKDEPRQLSLL
ncbi:hypothetical protein COR50_18685 [Chitinophaga caeni]|uniref:DUF72 domain-containing protein n=1 Tax=Chitinophaga caeni TaxID=2029983 RepID=A0A291QYV8_9BACT|nr:DUF72 domain-containing protein [Chitinophaga caeni]ATL49033.1 hypothetical protein COR50_18685 [Chitinophaga caeni]